MFSLYDAKGTCNRVGKHGEHNTSAKNDSFSPLHQILVVQLPADIGLCGRVQQLHLHQCHLHLQLHEGAADRELGSRAGEQGRPITVNKIKHVCSCRF